MLGPVTLRDVTLWMQTTKEASVKFGYRIKGGKTPFVYSDNVITKKENEYTVSVHISDVLPGATYEYTSYINNKQIVLKYPTEFRTQTHWQHRSDPPDFSFIAGSCMYINDVDFDRPGKGYGSGYTILNEMYKSRPDLMIWLGDNTYLREGDFESRAGIYKRQTHTRSLPELQPFLASFPQYATWDDHDYGTNDSDWTFPLKHHSLDAFKDFWPSESYGSGHTEGVTSSFEYNDCQFFMLDDRWYRTVEKEEGSILGQQQKYWLLESLLASNASFKFVAVGGQFLSDFAAYENFANYKAEREEIINFIDDHDLKGVVFLSGDRHHSEITMLKTEKGNVLYDVTSSSITSTTYDHRSEANTLRLPGSMVIEQNFALFNVSGDKKNRKLSLAFINKEGKEVGKYDFRFK
ncbi:MAG: alkaline phosphatase family protein [Saprospiraceae bacterium]|nr:alkaline phosphatase family protein [Saprospiraceae bacterium]